MSKMKKGSILTIAGIILAISGGFLSFCWDAIFNYVLAKEFPLTPTSKSFQAWKDPTESLALDFYFFNWTNPEDLLEKDYKPKLVEVGPYRFREYSTKVNVTWNDNNTISYQRRKFWYFDPEDSIGSLDDTICTLNPVALSAAYVMRYRTYSMKLSLGLTTQLTGQQVAIVRTAGEFLFTGISNELLSLASRLPQLSEGDLPGDKFAWFYKANGSSGAEGTFNVETGEQDITRIGRLREWNFRNRTDFYRGDCGMINGSEGTFHPPGQTRNSTIAMFSPEFCKAIKFEYLEDADVDGILGFRYVGSKKLLDSGELDPDNWCNCNGECVPQGVLNISACRYGAPVFMSYPHFLYADPSYLQQVEGLQPDEAKHRFHITIEPKTGLPIDFAVRFQVNILLQPFDYVTIYANVPRIFFPMMWFEETFRLSPENFADLKLLLSLPEKGLYLSVGIIILGLAMVAISVFRCFSRNSQGKDLLTEKSLEQAEPLRSVAVKNSPGKNILPDSKDYGNTVT